MKQLTQRLKSGQMELLEVPAPALGPRSVLVRTHFSVISAGTEGKSVRDARRGYVGKALAREKEVRQVLQAVRQNGLSSTYERVMNRLEAPSALGYSCAGEVIAVGEDVTEFTVGQRVACGGNGAVHAEAVAVPQNLCVKISDQVDLKHAAFTTIGAVALQGVRQAELGIGSNCLVIGLGLVGLLTAQLLEASGVRAIGVDVDPKQVDLAHRIGVSLALARNSQGVEDTIRQATRGKGVDAVIITASTDSTDPVELAGRLCRQKGHVVVVGGVPTGFSREHYYRKELDLRMSCSYGPGRYDPSYEEHGIDYPIGYVRWTENRNMQAFADLLEQRKIDVQPLLTHMFSLDRVAEAYELILSRTEPVGGVLLEYDTSRSIEKRIEVGSKAFPETDLRVGFIGAGSFAKNVLLPKIKGRASLVGVATARPNNARYVADKFGFQYCAGGAEEILADDGINVVFITTRHNLHAPMVLSALEAGKHVFVEKPLCLTSDELETIESAYAESNSHLMVGFNRRFAPQIRRLMASLPIAVPRAINYRINAGGAAPNHWIHDAKVGGGRIIGEVCHFIDLASYIAGSRVISVGAQAMADPDGLNDTLVLTMGFSNGSTAAISYFSNGNSRLPKERLEVFCAGETAVLDDFRTLTVYGDKTRTHRLRKQDKGHAEEIRLFLDAVSSGGPAPIAFD
ncbi:MAG: bi-domain-containing oxidoreductase, partial [Rhodothermales bacterium]